MHERRLDERGARAARRALVRSGPLAGDAVHHVGAVDRRRQSIGSDERDRERALDERRVARDEPVGEPVFGDRDVTGRSGIDAIGDPRPPGRGSEADEGHCVAPVAEPGGERPGLRLGPADRGEELLRDDDPHPFEPRRRS